MSVIRLVASHDGFLCDGLFADKTLTISTASLRTDNPDPPDTSSFRKLESHPIATAGLYLPTPDFHIWHI